MKAILKNFFSDLIYLYKNILHWNLSKIVIVFFVLSIGLVLSLPIILLALVLNGFDFSVLSYFNIWTISIYLIFVFIFGYSYVLLSKLSLSYLKNKKIKYKENFDLNYFWRYVRLALLFISILTIPFLVSIILNLIIIAMYGGIENTIKTVMTSYLNFYSIFNLILLIITVIATFYLSFRLVFSFIILVEDKKSTVIGSLEKSYKKTKGISKFFKGAFLVFVFSVVIIPFSMIGNFINSEARDINNYMDSELYKESNRQEVISSKNYYYNGLLVKYDNLKLEELKSIWFTLNVIYYLFKVFNFVFIFGVFTMVLTSFYKKIIK